MYVWGREKVVSDPCSEDQRCLALILALDATPEGHQGWLTVAGRRGLILDRETRPSAAQILHQERELPGRGEFAGTLNEVVVLHVWRSVRYSEEA